MVSAKDKKIKALWPLIAGFLMLWSVPAGAACLLPDAQTNTLVPEGYRYASEGSWKACHKGDWVYMDTVTSHRPYTPNETGICLPLIDQFTEENGEISMNFVPEKSIRKFYGFDHECVASTWWRVPGRTRGPKEAKPARQQRQRVASEKTTKNRSLFPEIERETPPEIEALFREIPESEMADEPVSDPEPAPEPEPFLEIPKEDAMVMDSEVEMLKPEEIDVQEVKPTPPPIAKPAPQVEPDFPDEPVRKAAPAPVFRQTPPAKKAEQPQPAKKKVFQEAKPAAPPAPPTPPPVTAPAPRVKPPAQTFSKPMNKPPVRQTPKAPKRPMISSPDSEVGMCALQCTRGRDQRLKNGEMQCKKKMTARFGNAKWPPGAVIEFNRCRVLNARQETNRFKACMMPCKK